MASETIYIVAPASMWGSVGYERFYYLLAHSYPKDELYECRFRPDMLAGADVVVLRPGPDSSVPRSTWAHIEQAQALKKRIMLARVYDGSRLSLASMERYEVLINDADEAHYATFHRRPHPEGKEAASRGAQLNHGKSS